MLQQCFRWEYFYPHQDVENLQISSMDSITALLQNSNILKAQEWKNSCVYVLVLFRP